MFSIWNYIKEIFYVMIIYFSFYFFCFRIKVNYKTASKIEIYIFQ